MPELDASGGRVLLVDDDPSVLRSYSQSLRKSGFEVTEVSDGEEAVRRLDRQSFDLVLSDATLPKIDGLALWELLRRREPELPVILLMSTTDNRTSIKAVEGGALQCLIKPVDPEALEEAVTNAVRRHWQRVSLISLRTRRGQRIGAWQFRATDAKNQFGRLLDTAIQEGAVVITKHDTPKAVLLSLDEFNALARARKLETLRGELDDMLARMQTPGAGAAMKAAFDASPSELGQAALAATRKRG